MDLRTEIHGAFQEILLPQIQKDLSALKEDVQDMRRDLQLLTESSRGDSRDSGEGRGSTWNTNTSTYAPDATPMTGEGSPFAFNTNALDAAPRTREGRGSTFNTNALDVAGSSRGSLLNTNTLDVACSPRGSALNTNALDVACSPRRDTFSVSGSCEVAQQGRLSSSQAMGSWATRAMRKKSNSVAAPDPANSGPGRSTVSYVGSSDKAAQGRTSKNGGSWASRAMRKKSSRGHALEQHMPQQLALPNYIAEGNSEDKEAIEKDGSGILSNRFTFIVPQPPPAEPDRGRKTLPPGRASIMGRTSILREDERNRMSRLSNQSLPYAESNTSESGANGHASHVRRFSQRGSHRRSTSPITAPPLRKMQTRQSMAAGKVSLALARTTEFGRKETFAEWMWSLTQPQTWRGLSAKTMLQSSKFDNIISFLIIGNSITIGMEADYAARNITERSPWTYRAFEIFFCVVFTSEITLRVWVYKKGFFLKWDQSVLWNYFDFLVVFAQLFQEAIEFLRPDSEGSDADNLRILRILRVLRIVRIFRLVRVLHLISELRTIVSSIMGSFRSLFWTVILLLLLMYIVGVWFLQSVTDHFIEHRAGVDSDNFSLGENQLREHFDSLAQTILSLWQALSGGVNWGEVANPLISEVQPLLGLAFAMYIAFALLALMNVVTGVFVQTALTSADREEESFLTSQIIQLFHKCKEDDSWGSITEQDLEERLDDPELAKEWKNISVSPDEAHYVFALLDVDESGEVQFEEFLSACLRLKGNAKSLDMLIQLQESRHNTKVLEEMFGRLEDRVAGISDHLQLKSPAGKSPKESVEKPKSPRRSSYEPSSPRYSSGAQLTSPGT